MLQCRLGPPRRLHLQHLALPGLDQPLPTGCEQRRRDVNCFQSRAKLARKCSTRATSARVCTRLARVYAMGVGVRWASVFLDSIAPRYYVRRPGGRGRRGKIHYLSHSGARALSGTI